jgi:signal transduction histidine kinase/ActR/RegA family two-component response regulator
MAQRVLYVCDSADACEALWRHCARIPGLDFDLVQAGTYEEGIEVLDRESFDLLFLTDLPGPISAVDFVQRAREVGFEGALIVLGDDFDARLASNLVRAGADEVLPLTELTGELLLQALELAKTSTIRRKAEGKLQAKTLKLAEMLESESLALREVEVARARAEDANRAKSTFLANMSHEIRTPLTAILGYAEELRDEELSETERREAIRIIHENGQVLLRILSDILDFSKIEAGKLGIERLSVSPSQIIHDVCQLLEPGAREKGIALEHGIDASVAPFIMSDPIRLRQILMNLISNAVKFTERGRVSVHARMGLGAEPPAGSRQLEIEVSDTGVGMTGEEIQRIFAPFAQADLSTTRRFGGTGLGLVIAKRLAELLGGDIVVKSRPGEGSSFRVTIDAGGALESPVAGEGIEAGRRHPDREDPLPKCRILLADDNAVNRRLVSRILTRSGATVVEAENGKAALEVALDPSQEIDLVLMDIQMPELDGYEATRALRQAGFERPVIALTGNAIEAERQKCLESGFNGFTTKPIQRQALANLIRSHLEASRAR